MRSCGEASADPFKRLVLGGEKAARLQIQIYTTPNFLELQPHYYSRHVQADIFYEHLLICFSY